MRNEDHAGLRHHHDPSRNTHRWCSCSTSTRLARPDLLNPDVLTTEPALPTTQFHDAFGNICTRLIAPPGQIRFTTNALIADPGTPDPYAPDAIQHEVSTLPDECMQFLLGSRYCETDNLMDVAWENFNTKQNGWGRVPGDRRLRS